MPNRKAGLYVLMLMVLTACTKQDITPGSRFTEVKTVDIDLLQSYQQTIFGLLEANATTSQTKADMKEANVKLIRIPIVLSKTTINKTIDQYITDGYNVQINANWNDGINGARDFPYATDTNTLKSQAEVFFKYYATHLSQVSFVVIENEWDYEVQNGANIKDYLTELSIMTTIGHKYGFKIADGGITSGALQRWTYSQLSGTAQQQWAANYYVGLDNDYNTLMNIINTYIASAKNISFDYSNAHWYNSSICGNGFVTATQTFMKACNKNTPVCNEFGIRTNSQSLYSATVNEIKTNALYAVAYSGINSSGKAIKLTNAMLDLLR